MVAAARELLFEKAALIRDQIRELERLKSGGKPEEEPEKYKPPLHFRRGVALREAKIAKPYPKPRKRKKK